MPKSIPRHHYSDFANTVHNWMPTDSHDRWQRNCNDPMQRSRLQQHGWLPEREITYSFNSHGFRSPEFDHQPSMLCLGCSHTMGIGLPLEHTWPSILQQNLKINCWNLGLGGAALDTVFRMANHYVHHLNVMAVVCLLPEIKRFEIFANGQLQVLNIWHHSHTDIFRDWMSDDQNADVNQTKNLLAMQQICHIADVPFVYTSCLPDLDAAEWDEVQDARDLLHYGYKMQCRKAEKFQSMLLLQKSINIL